MRWKWSWWYPLVLAALAWRAIYAYWAPLVNKYVVPPGDDPAYHISRVADLLAGNWSIFAGSYPQGFHVVTALIGKVAGWDALEAVRLVGPVLLVAPVLVLYFFGKRAFSPAAGAFAALFLAFLALAPVRAYGDGNYANMLAAGVFTPLALLFLLQYARDNSLRTALFTVVFFIGLSLTHHLTLLHTLAVALPLLVWIAVDHFKNSTRRSVVLGLAMIVGLLTVLLRPYYQSFLLPYLSALQSQGTLAGFFGAASKPITWEGLLEIHNPAFVVIGLAGAVVLLLSRINIPTKLLMASWIGLLWALSVTPVFGLPERFVRDLAIPLALAAGFLVGHLWEQAQTRAGKGVVITLAVGLMLLDVRASFQRPFALPDPYTPLIRVQHEEEFALATLRTVAGPDTTVLSNNSNPYLPYLVQARILIAVSPGDVDGKLATEPVHFLFIGSLPPLIREDLYPFYAHFVAIRERLLAIPDKELIEELPTGTEIYRLK